MLAVCVTVLEVYTLPQRERSTRVLHLLLLSLPRWQLDKALDMSGELRELLISRSVQHIERWTLRWLHGMVFCMFSRQCLGV